MERKRGERGKVRRHAKRRSTFFVVAGEKLPAGRDNQGRGNRQIEQRGGRREFGLRGGEGGGSS